jgi:hypothetical protein
LRIGLCISGVDDFLVRSIDAEKMSAAKNAFSPVKTFEKDGNEREIKSVYQKGTYATLFTLEIIYTLQLVAKI